IRARNVTGVQTCALPIWPTSPRTVPRSSSRRSTPTADISPRPGWVRGPAEADRGTPGSETRAARGEWRFGEEHIGKITGLTERSRLRDGPDFSGFSKLVHPRLSHEDPQYSLFLLWGVASL